MEFDLDGVRNRVISRGADGLLLVEDGEGDRCRYSQGQLFDLQEGGRLKPAQKGSRFEPSFAIGPLPPNLAMLAPTGAQSNGSVATKDCDAKRNVAEAKLSVLEALKETRLTSRSKEAAEQRRTTLKAAGLREEVHPSTLTRWRQRYRADSIDGLISGRPGPKGPRKGFFQELATSIFDEFLLIDQPTDVLSAHQTFVTRAEVKRAEENARRSATGQTDVPAVPSYSWFSRRLQERKARDLATSKGRYHIQDDFDIVASGPITTKLLRRTELDRKRVPIILREEPEKAGRYRRSDLLILGAGGLEALVDRRSGMPLDFISGLRLRKTLQLF
ncbi:MAG: hypothetical protein JWL84_1711 [Rhodospirillales bacterium]|nr:hypothetical protein [Rhodospirillales bacterium]